MDITEDQTSSDQLRDAFRGIANDKVISAFRKVDPFIDERCEQSYVTELDLKVALLPQPAIDYLRAAMPAIQNGAGEGDAKAYDYESWLDRVFE